MKHLGYIGDAPHHQGSPVLAALEELKSTGEYSLCSVADIHDVDSIVRRAWAVLNLADVVIAHFGKGGANLCYEIGLAHGLGKPVVLVADEGSSVPADLADQRVIMLEKGTFSRENLAWRLREVIEHIGQTQNSQVDYWGPRSLSRQDHWRRTVGGYTFRALFANSPSVLNAQFKRWFVELASHVPGWDVVESPVREKYNAGFDVVIWNNRDDHELAALGNPIAVEAKSTRSFNSSSMQTLALRAEGAGLRAIILVTSGSNDAASQRRVRRELAQHDILLVTLDKQDFLEVANPEMLLEAVRLRTREALYGSGA